MAKRIVIILGTSVLLIGVLIVIFSAEQIQYYHTWIGQSLRMSHPFEESLYQRAIITAIFGIIYVAIGLGLIIEGGVRGFAFLLIFLLLSTFFFQISKYLFFNSLPINEAISITRLRMRDAVVNGMPYVHAYANVWARDTLFSSYGFIADGQYNIVKKLLYYLWNGRYTSAKGDSISVITNTTYPRSGEDGCIDSTPLWIIIADEYLKNSDDNEFKKFLEEKQCFLKLKKWMDSRIDNSLVSQYGPDNYYSDWSDSARKELKPKYVMYSNILFWKAYTIVDQRQANSLRENIENSFWNGKYYRDFVGGEHLSADGNLLAIIWNFTNKNHSVRILQNMEDMIFPMPTITVKPKYTHDPNNYQNGRVWGWLGALSIIAYLEVGDLTKAKRVYENLSALLQRERWRFSELYTDQGKLSGAQFFIWFSGLFMYALCQLNIGITIPIFSNFYILTSTIVIVLVLHISLFRISSYFTRTHH